MCGRAFSLRRFRSSPIPALRQRVATVIYPNVSVEEVSLLKPVVWMGDSLQRIRGAVVNVRSEAGHQLELVQGGEMPEDFRPMRWFGSH